MASVKKLSGNLIIQAPRNVMSSNVTFDVDTVYIAGNLTVLGNTTSIVSNNTSITDNIIILNYGETGNGVTLGSAGITVGRGTAPGGNVSLRWLESTKTWQVSGVVAGSPGDGAQYSNILTSASTGIITSVFDDKAPVLGGNLNVNNFTIYANVAAGTYVTLQGALNLKSANVTPTAATGSTVFYASDTGAGQAGVFVVNPASTNEELITKRRAFGFSLIL